MNGEQTILVVDDINDNRKMLSTLLTPMGYTVVEAADGEEAIELFQEYNPDLLILDLTMPKLDGFEVCKRLKSDPKSKIVPIIVITGVGDDESHLKALELGADDFLPKPFNIHFLKARLKSLLAMKRLYDKNQEYQEKLKNDNVSLMQKLIGTQDITIVALAKLAEFRDPETGEHLERMREYAKTIALELKKQDKYKDYITEQYIENIYKSTPLHDIGKVGIPDEVLLKPGKLTDDEFEIMKRHSEIGGDAISSAVNLSGMTRSFLDMGKEIAYHHHEKWDGNGYPKGLKNDGIPLTARITALADVYDALTTKRVYKPAFPHDKAKAILEEGSGTVFDPEIVAAFISKENEFIRIKEEYKDNNGTGSSTVS
jgi:putative two-component system response regulator